MKLREIVAYINLLDSLSMDAECNEAVRLLDSILHIVTNHSLQLDMFSKTLTNDFETISSGVNAFRFTLERLKQKLYDEVAVQEPEYFRESKRMFDHDAPYETNEYILNRRLGIDPDSNILLRSHLRSLGDWRLPGLILRPGRETFIEDMVPLDPLYLVDQHEELLKPSVDSFTPEYQQRLRKYIVDDRQDGAILTDLPQGQFGLVFAYNYFNFRPIELIQKYLTELYAVMRPGGTLIMTYNNCDRAQGVGLAERGFMCYTPKRHIQQHAESVGFESTFEHNGLGDLSWLEFVKPGDITSIRGGQTLAKLVAKTE
jgi:SAM-dependent methyltransferase